MLKKVISDESGRTLGWTLIILAIGVLLIPTFLSHTSANLFAARAIEEGLKKQYAADAGVEYALYLLANNDCPDGPFSLPTAVNGKLITVTVENVGNYYAITSAAGGTVIGSDSEYAPAGNLDIYEGALVSEGNITLAKDCTVDGDIRYGGEFYPTLPFTHTNGSAIPGDIEFPPSDEFAQTYKDEAMACGDPCIHDDDMDIPRDSTISLGPKYITGDLKVGRDSVITLTGTIYVEGEDGIDVDDTSEFRGSGNIVAVHDIKLAKLGCFGTDSDAIIMSVNGAIEFKKEVDVKALIYAPEGLITFNKDSSVMGGVVGAEINAKKLELFAYDASFYDGFRLPGYEDARFKLITYDIDLNSE